MKQVKFKALILGIVLGIFFSGQLVAQKKTNVETKEKNGLNTTTFSTPNGTVTVFLPDNAYAGDIISGTVIAEPKGKNERQITKNKNILNGYVVDMADKKADVKDKRGKFKLPPKVLTGLIPLILLNKNGKKIASADLPVNELPRDIPIPDKLVEGDFTVPPYVTSGGFDKVEGFFDGAFDNSGIKIGDEDVDLIAESPDALFFETPEGMDGVTEITVTEGDLSFTEKVNVLNMNISAEKLNLGKGEQTTVSIHVSGLNDLEMAIPLLIVNLSFGTITMEGGNEQEVMIHPEEVSPEGEWVHQFSVTAIHAGPFSILAEILKPDATTIQDTLN